jgi:putative addiction module killer protein
VSTIIERKTVFFKDEDNSEPVLDWLNELKKKRRVVEHSKITTRINRAAQGNLGDHRMLGGAFGPAYRVYFGLDGNELIVLLSGGSKDNQQADIELAKSRWERYRKNKEGARD